MDDPRETGPRRDLEPRLHDHTGPPRAAQPLLCSAGARVRRRAVDCSAPTATHTTRGPARRVQTFSARGDFDLMLTVQADPRAREALLDGTRRLRPALLALPQPLIVGVQGAAVGPGAIVALAADAVVAGSDAVLDSWQPTEVPSTGRQNARRVPGGDRRTGQRTAGPAVNESIRGLEPPAWPGAPGHTSRCGRSSSLAGGRAPACH